MAGRALILLAVAVLVTVTVLVVRSWSGRRVGGLDIDGAARLWSALEASPDGRPSLVVFSTPSCTACRVSEKAPEMIACDAMIAAAVARAISGYKAHDGAR